MYGQCHVAVFAGQFVGQVEQQGADGGNGFVAVGDQDFAADAGGDAEEGGCLWDCLGIGAGIEVVINGALGSLVEF